MSNLVINANSIYDRVIRIGRQTENLVSSITFNVQMWIEEYGAGECVLNVKRNGDGNAYPVPMTIADGMTTWTITDTDTAKKGHGEIQLFYTVGEKVKTSPIFTISCGESLVGGEVPEPYEEWLTELNRMTAQVEAAKTSASASAQTAQTAAQTATEKATEAEQSAEFAYNHYESARQSAVSAQASKTGAVQAAANAHESATESAQSATMASTASVAAEAAKTAAQTAESNAQGFAQTASAKASEAAESAANAAKSVTDAKAEADRAKTYADRAAEVELEIPTKVSQLENDAGYLTEHQSLDDYVRKDVLYNLLPVDTASGSIASFPDGADNIPLESLVANIDPVQDLHGYDSPWPAGGRKNLLPEAGSRSFDKYGVTVTIATDGTITINGTATDVSYICVPLPSPLPIGDYTYSWFNNYVQNANRVEWSLRKKDYAQPVGGWNTASVVNRTYSFTITEPAYYWQIQIPKGGIYENFTCHPMLVAGSTAATEWTPYSNICPISGWAGCNLNVNNAEIPISWESEAGTVYGGSLDVLNGVLTVDKGFILSYNGEFLPSTWISDRDIYAEGVSPTTGAEVCYTLAEPITYQLTPTEVNSFLGSNNIYADTGDAFVEYRADTKAYINRKIAEAIAALS